MWRTCTSLLALSKFSWVRTLDLSFKMNLLHRILDILNKIFLGIVSNKWLKYMNNEMHLPSLFMLAWKHFDRRQALHWFRCVLSTGHLPFRSPVALQVYTLFRWMLRLKNPEHPFKVKRLLIIIVLTTYDYSNKWIIKQITYLKK